MVENTNNAKGKENSIPSANDEVFGFNEYNRNYSNILHKNTSQRIVTNGKRGCHWIWFAHNQGWKTGKHALSIKCNGLPIKHQTGNIIAIIGATNYDLIKKRNLWEKDECILDIDFDEMSDVEDEEEGEKDQQNGEIVSMSFDWNGYLYKNDSMLIHTESPWTVKDELTVVIDIDGRDIKFLKNGKSVTDIPIVPAEGLVWFPVLQCCGCNGHRYTCQFK